MSLSKPLTLRHLCHLLNNILGLFYHRHIVFLEISLVKNTKYYLPKKSAPQCPRNKLLATTCCAVVVVVLWWWCCGGGVVVGVLLCWWCCGGGAVVVHRLWMYYLYICDIGEEKSLWDRCSSIVLRVAICCVGLAARNFGNGRVVLCAWETVIASSGLQLLWEGYVFFWGGGGLWASCII